MGILNIENETLLSDCRKFVFSFISLGILILILYSNTFHTSWHFDDEGNILQRDSIHLTDFSWDQIRGTFFNKDGYLHRPVANLSLAINYYFNRDNVWGYHLVNTLIHFVTASFLFLFVYQVLRLPLLRKKYGQHAYFVALLSSVLWAINPVQTQAITYIVQRMASMAGMFYIMSMTFYIHGRVSSQKGVKAFAFSVCVITGLLACGSKENAVMLPFTIILLDLVLIQGLSKKNILKIGIFLLLCALVAQALMWWTRGLSIFSLEPLIRDYSLRNFTLMERLLTESRVIVFYISLLLYPMPSRLCIIHTPMISTGLFDPLTTFFSILCILGMIVFALTAAKKFPLLSFCILFFFLNHTIESTIFPLELVFEHRNYIPSMLFFVPISILLMKGLRVFSHRPAMQRIITAFIIFVIISNGHGTFVRNVIWNTDESLWMDAADKYPNSRRAYQNLGGYYSKKDQFGKAEMCYKRALTLPEESHGNKTYLLYFNLGTVYAKTSKPREAEDQFRMSIAAIPPGLVFSSAHNNLGILMLFEKRYQEALDTFAEALGDDPDNPDLHHNLGVLLIKTGQPREAIIEFTRALDLGNTGHETLEYLGICYKRVGEYGKATYYLRQAISKNPRSILTHLHLAEVYLMTSKKETAERLIDEALSRIPLGIVFEELQACANEKVLRELPEKSGIISLFNDYFSRDVDSLEEIWN